jgi:hypothetical protein
MNDRLPEMVWLSLILTAAPRELWAKVLGHLGSWYVKAGKQEGSTVLGPSLTDIAKMDPDLRADLLDDLCSPDAVRHALRPLLLFDNLPARAEWASRLEGPTSDDWDRVATAVLETLDHQSDVSTHVRWLSVVSLVAQGRLLYPAHLSHIEEEIRRFPLDPTPSAAATVRAAEVGLEMPFLLDGTATPRSPWPTAFWDQCLRDTSCMTPRAPAQPQPAIGTTTAQVASTRTELIKHAYATRSSSAVDSRHETTFGLALYSVSLLGEIFRVGNATSIVGRLALRSLAEIHITLKYLLRHDKGELWQAYRRHGTGQAKLHPLKLEDAPPTSVDIETLERLAGEDLWLELVPIELGHWAKMDLRKMSEDAGVKDVYDSYYGWPANYVHGQWSALRDAEYQTCFNPLHRVHRVPLDTTRSLPDVVVDATQLVNLVLASLDSAYPTFAYRLKAP